MDDQKLNKKFPETVSDAVEKLLFDLPQIDKVRIANISENDLVDLHFSLGMQIRDGHGLWADNEKLIQSCRQISGDKNLHIDDASLVIIRKLWVRLKETNRIRVIK